MTLTTQDTNTYSQEDIRLMKETVCRGCTEADFKLFLMVCQRTRLDPFAKQIYAVARWDSKLGRNSMTIQSSIDGLRLVAERTGRYAPGRATAYEYDQNGKIRSATAFVKKQTSDGSWHEVSYTAFFDEYCQKTKDGVPTKFWKDMGHVMIAKVAEAACLRRAFPMELSGLYTKDEMEQSECEVVVVKEEKHQLDNQTQEKMEALISQFDASEKPLLLEYFDKWKKAHQKTDVDVVQRFENVEELKNNFLKWKEKKAA